MKKQYGFILGEHTNKEIYYHLADINNPELTP